MTSLVPAGAPAMFLWLVSALVGMTCGAADRFSVTSPPIVGLRGSVRRTLPITAMLTMAGLTIRADARAGNVLVKDMSGPRGGPTRSMHLPDGLSDCTDQGTPIPVSPHLDTAHGPEDYRSGPRNRETKIKNAI
jgi:hypothetical protein